jgi:alkylation response protein AidB-like acyl-CoA dehydrogenase
MALAVGAQLVGLAAAMVDQAAEYARQRHQFGKPIGSFQAVKHLLADALLAVDFARAPLWRAAWSVDEGMPTAPADVSAARVLTDAAAQRAARSALQVHGAIGYTWECDLHLWMKKVWALCPSWGDATWHRRRVSQWLLEGKGPVSPDGETMPGLEQLR